MPLIHHTEVLQSQIYFWEITEELPLLKKYYPTTEKEQKALMQIKLEIKQKHFLLLRYLLQRQGICPSELYYLPSGKPLLRTKGYLSVSHSKDIFALAISTQPIGIDIELQTPRILRVAHKFTQWEGNSMPQQLQIQAFTQIWTIKEALYKAHNAQGANFKTQLLTDEVFSPQKNTYTGRVSLSGMPSQAYQLYTNTFQNYAWSIATKV